MSARVLVVDENPDNRKLLLWVLEELDVEVEEAETAEEALALIAADRPDLVLMDISLPGMNGDEACRRLRARPETAELPIVAVTAHAIPREAERIRASGVDLLLTKPIDEDALLACVETLLAR